MSPEYAMHGQFSVKSDVFSFGVLVLEIINGKMSRDFIKPGNAEDFLYYVSTCNWENNVFIYLLL